jgi:hypothetical protein
MDVILEACPSFRDEWIASDDKESLHVVMGDLARHLLALFLTNSESELFRVGAAIERLHLHGDDQVKELATIGLLESIQNNWSHTDVDPEAFVRYLPPESAKWWRSLERFWRGEIPFVGQDIAPR